MLTFAHDQHGNHIGFDRHKLIQERLLIQGSSGSGKSYLLRSLVEQALRHGLATTILDPEGEFSTLADLYPITAIAASALPSLPSRSALAESSARHRQSYTLDLSDTPPEERPEIVADLIDAHLDLPRSHWHNRLLVIDEAHELAPQAGKVVSRYSIARLAALGRKRGLALIAATQRISKMDKNVIAELRNVLVGQTTHDADARKSLETLALPCTAPHRRLVKSLAYQFLPFGPSLGYSPTSHLLKALPPRTAPPASGIKTANLDPHHLQVTHYLRRSGIFGGLDYITTHSTEAQTVADYLAACLYLDDTCRVEPAPAPTSLGKLLTSAFAHLESRHPLGHFREQPSTNPNASYLWVYWGNSLPPWVSYRQPYRPPQPIDSVLRGHSTYQYLQSKDR